MTASTGKIDKWLLWLFGVFAVIAAASITAIEIIEIRLGSARYVPDWLAWMLIGAAAAMSAIMWLIIGKRNRRPDGDARSRNSKV